MKVYYLDNDNEFDDDALLHLDVVIKFYGDEIPLQIEQKLVFCTFFLLQ